MSNNDNVGDDNDADDDDVDDFCRLFLSFDPVIPSFHDS